MSTSKHSELILDQFTRQAVPFATAAVIKDEAGLIARSFPRPGDADRIRAIVAESLADDALDMQVRREGDRLVFGGYPVAVLAARRG